MEKLRTPFLIRSLFFIAFVSAIVAGLHSDMFKIQMTLVEESPESLGREVFQSLAPRATEISQVYHQQNLWWVNVNDIATRMREIPGVKDVVVERVPPQTLKITILPESIRFMYVSSAGKLYPVTESSAVIKNFKSSQYPDVPITRDKNIIQNSKIRAQAIDLVSSLPSTGLFSLNTIAEFELDAKSASKTESENKFWLSLIHPDVKVKMSAQNSAKKAERVERVLDYTQKHNLHARVIDSEYSKKVVVKLRKDR